MERKEETKEERKKGRKKIKMEAVTCYQRGKMIKRKVGKGGIGSGIKAGSGKMRDGVME